MKSVEQPHLGTSDAMGRSTPTILSGKTRLERVSSQWHSTISEWLDEYDPDELEVFPIEVALGRIAARRNAAAKRILKSTNN
jgi:hypothetical protein